MAQGELDALFGELGLAATPEQAAALVHYLDLLERWNGTYNLTAVRDRAAMRLQHLADCMAAIPPLSHRLPCGRVLDVGSGGGLPGVVIAILMHKVDVTCVDAVGKKTAFVRQVAGELKLPNLHAHHARVESIRLPSFDLITSRAFASLNDFVRLTRPLLSADGVWMAMKGKWPDEEIAQLPPDVEVFHVEQLAVPGLDAERCLIWLRPAAARSAN